MTTTSETRSMRSFFEWFQDRQIDPKDPWLMLGKGPSFARKHAYDTDRFHTMTRS